MAKAFRKDLEGDRKDRSPDSQSIDMNKRIPGPTLIDDLTIIIKTKDTKYARTTDPIELCINEQTCFPLEIKDIPVEKLTARGSVSVLHIRNLKLLEEDFTKIQLRSAGDPNIDNNAWEPSCLALRFNGKPVYCNDTIDAVIGTGKGVGESLSDGVIKFDGIPDAHADYIQRITVDNLTSDTRYYYRFEVEGGFNTKIFPLKTLAPEGENKKTSLVFGSCSNRTDEEYAFEHIVALNPKPDLFIFGGDTHYANSVRRDAQSWHLLRARRAISRAETIANIPTIASWDDHDFAGNNSDGTCAGIPESTTSFVEHWMNPKVDTSKGIYYKYRQGPADIFMLDCRTHRPDVNDDSKKCIPNENAPVLSIQDGMLGKEQTQWLLDSLENSTAPFKLVVCGSQ